MPTSLLTRRSTGGPTRTRWSLVRRLQSGGDEQAWQEFHAAYGPLLHNLAIRCGLTHQEAEEAVQDTLTSVFKNLPKFKADPEAGSFKNWLFRLARWRISNQYHKRPRYSVLVGEPPSPGDSSETATRRIERIPDPSPDALELAWDREWRENALEIALHRLRKQAKARHFQAFYLHVIKHQSPGQVAQALGISIAQVYLVKCRLLPVFKRIVRNLEHEPA